MSARWCSRTHLGMLTAGAMLSASLPALAGEPAVPMHADSPVAAGVMAPPLGVTADPPSRTSASSEEAWLLPTFVVLPPDAGRRARADGPHALRAKQIDATLSDAVQDLGLKLAVSESPPEDRPLSHNELLAKASQTARWLIYPTIDAHDGEPELRIVAIAPGSKVLEVRTEPLNPAELAVQAVVMLRDLVAARGRGPSELSRRRSDRAEAPGALAVRARSVGRGTLALNAALFGGFVGYSVQRASGGEDPRLLYPLMALGTGLGLGASAIVAEEWDVGLGDAWYLSAGAWWPALAGMSIARSRASADASNEYASAVIGAATGLGLATTALAFGGISEGGALMTHSGGAFGAVLGGLADLSVRGSTEGPLPYEGMGYGAAAGVLVAGTMATIVNIDASRVLAIDLGAGLGGLAGAAATSPFIFRKHTVAGDRAFLLATIGATLAGGALGWWWSRHSVAPTGTQVTVLPVAGPMGESVSVRGQREPWLGAGVVGTF